MSMTATPPVEATEKGDAQPQSNPQADSQSAEATSRTEGTPPQPTTQDKPSGKASPFSVNNLIRQAAGYEAPTQESGSAEGEANASDGGEQRPQTNLLEKPLKDMTPDELRDAVKQRPDFFRVYQSESDKARANGDGEAREGSEDELEKAQRTLDAAVASVFSVMDRDILNGVLWEALPQESKVKMSGKSFGQGGTARVNAVKAYVEEIRNVGKAEGRAELEAEILRNGGVRQTLAKRANAEERERESGEDLPDARRSHAAPATPSQNSSQQMNSLIRGAR